MQNKSVLQKSNRLANEKSPYLLQHAQNPVDWYPWGDEAFREAARRGVPVFLSIGYSSCHWCHVMERESFEDNEVADILNKNFVSIKVDREERPDIDHLYMEACVAWNGSGGWPLTAFLTHDRRPFFAGTYFPKQDSMGRMGLISLLNSINETWTTKQSEIEKSADTVIDYLKKHSDSLTPPDTSVNVVAYEQFEQSFDKVYGGFEGAPKFPSVHNLLFLLRYGMLHPESKAFELVNKTLRGMEQGGIFDHIGGGFFRYSTDSRWLVPHFEKMMYDNAMLLMAYSEASVAIDKRYEETARRTADYCMREMLSPEGGFYTAQDADSEGVEGKYYLWTPAEIIKCLGDTAGRQYCADYDITENGNFERNNIPNRIGKDVISGDTRHSSLLTMRSGRVPPLKDDKILTSSNGLAIAALSVAGRLLKEKSYTEQAEKTADFILKNLFVSGRLMARYRDGEAAHPAVLDDYAYLLWGLVELYEATYNPKWLASSIDLSEQILNLFSDETGGLFLSGKDVSDLPIRQKNYNDGALPSGNAIAAYNFSRLSLMTENDRFEKYAENIILASGDELQRAPYAYTGQLIALMQKHQALSVGITAGEDLEKLQSVLSGYHPFVLSYVFGKGFEVTNALLSNAAERPPIGGKATAYVCGSFGCRPPLTDCDELSKLLDI
ncbi:MAG: thioredoxin domain-containing protein [Bacillota bacterium]|nr:thioredoxin domain-containing protein [Bacillota bacterium]